MGKKAGVGVEWDRWEEGKIPSVGTGESRVGYPGKTEIKTKPLEVYYKLHNKMIPVLKPLLLNPNKTVFRKTCLSMSQGSH